MRKLLFIAIMAICALGASAQSYEIGANGVKGLRFSFGKLNHTDNAALCFRLNGTAMAFKIHDTWAEEVAPASPKKADRE